jgi:hypothetical protein
MPFSFPFGRYRWQNAMDTSRFTALQHAVSPNAAALAHPPIE